MKTTLLNIIGAVLTIAGTLLFYFCYLVSDPNGIEGKPGSNTPLSAYLISLIPIALGILLLILSYIIKKKRISN